MDKFVAVLAVSFLVSMIVVAVSSQQACGYKGRQRSCSESEYCYNNITGKCKPLSRAGRSNRCKSILGICFQCCPENQECVVTRTRRNGLLERGMCGPASSTSTSTSTTTMTTPTTVETLEPTTQPTE